MSEEREDPQAPSAAGAGEQAFREQTSEMAQTADRMEGEIDELGSDIADAKKTAAQRQDAPAADEDPLAGDWEGEAAGADQGDDATDDGEIDGKDGDAEGRADGDAADDADGEAEQG